MDVHGRVRVLAEEFGPEGYERAQLFRAELLSHFLAAEREAREDCHRAAVVRAQAAEAVGDHAGAKAVADLAQYFADGGRVKP